MAADLTTKADLPSAWLIRFSPYLKAARVFLKLQVETDCNTAFF